MIFVVGQKKYILHNMEKDQTGSVDSSILAVTGCKDDPPF